MSEPHTKDPTAPSPVGPDTDSAGGPVKSCFSSCNLHPTDCYATLNEDGKEYGLIAHVTWRSPTGKLADLDKCYTSEMLTFSPIPNPPFQMPGGGNIDASPRRLAEGKPVKAPTDGMGARDGFFFDLHQHPRHMVKWPPLPDPPPPEGWRSGPLASYVVNQTYDYYCMRCDSGWVPFGKYTILYAVDRDADGAYVFFTQKSGRGGPIRSYELIKYP